MKNAKIKDLKAQIEGLRQDLALGVITKSEFGVERGKLLAQIDALDTRPNCTFSRDPTLEESALKTAKNKMAGEVWGLYKSKALTKAEYYQALGQIAAATTEADLQSINPAAPDLPDLNEKPRTQNAAA